MQEPEAEAPTHNHRQVTGYTARVRIQETTKGPRRKSILLYYGKIRELNWDPARLKWPGDVDFLKYSTKLGRDLLRKRHLPLQLVFKKWPQTLLDNFRFRWTNIWDHERQRKEAGLIWQIWHKAVAVNVWRGRISHQIDTTCSVCPNGEDETVLHRFWDCPTSQMEWSYITHLLNYLAHPDQALSWATPHWKQAIFATRPPRRFRTVSRYWILLRGVALWTIWISRNDASFNHNRWNREKTEQVVWQNFSDYGRCAWTKTRQKVLRNPASSETQLAKFDAQWLKPAICTRNGLSVTWIRVRPAGIG
jgi:hypothetical protein